VTIIQRMRAYPGTTFLLFVIVMILLTIGLPRVVHGQTWHGYSISQSPPDCNLARMSSDNFIGDGRAGTITARRYQLHLISIGSAALASVAVNRLLHLAPVKSAFVGGVGTGIIPHYRGAIVQRRYPIDPGDVVADATMRMIPFIVVNGHKDHSFGGHVRTAFEVVSSYAAVACLAHP
jgi:hypothetical protein